MIRLSDLDQAKVRRESGERLGRVHEVHAKGGQVTTLVCGAMGLLERLSSSRAGRRIAWSDVVSVSRGEIVVRDLKR